MGTGHADNNGFRQNIKVCCPHLREARASNVRIIPRLFLELLEFSKTKVPKFEYSLHKNVEVSKERPSQIRKAKKRFEGLNLNCVI